jgi:hypothetical protein|nr:MAG TPA: hypothetical protein [Caudoviricetes sp.]
MNEKTTYYIQLTNDDYFIFETEEPVLVMYERAVERNEPLLKLETPQLIETDDAKINAFVTIPVDSILYVLEEVKC